MNLDFFRANRHSFSQRIQGGVAVLSGYTQVQRNNDMAHRFEQEANFWWLTGIESPDWWTIIDGTRQKCWLVAPEISQSHQIFDGSLKPDDALAVSGADEVISQDQAMRLLRDLAKKHSVMYVLSDQPYSEYLDFTLNPAIKAIRDTVGRICQTTQDCRKELAQLRAIKQPYEIEMMQKAIDVTLKGFEYVKDHLDTFSYEYQVEAEFTYQFRKQGADGHAYDPIVAAGMNACTLHYVANREKLKKRQLLLLDIGARKHGYSADITRTYAYGEPTKRQQQVHKAVAQAQQQIIELLQPNVSVEQYHQQVDEIMITALLSLDLMTDKNDTDTFRKYFPHAISHGLGIDVHDSLGAPKFLEPGMVLTVEPGIYIPEEAIGVRIEDDILVTAEGHRNLSAQLSTDL